MIHECKTLAVRAEDLPQITAAPRLPPREGAVPLPYLCPGFTDAKSWSRLGARCYGFLPLQLPPGIRFADLFHGDDERIPLAGLDWGTRVLWDTLATL